MQRHTSEACVYFDRLYASINEMFENDIGNTSLIFLIIFRKIIKQECPEMYDEYDDIINRIQEKINLED